MTKLSQLISIVFHPLLLTTYLVLVFGFLFPPMLMLPHDKLFVFAGVIFAITFALPALNLIIFRQFKIISSLSMSDRKDRTTPFIFIAILYVMVAALFVYRIHLSVNFTKIMIITSTLVVVTCLITFFYKVSVHSLAMWGAVGIILPLNKVAGGSLLYATIALVLIAGLVMTARLQLNAHTPREILVGALTGFAIGYAGILFIF